MAEEVEEQRLPQTDSIQEQARFLDSHDVTKFEEELEEVSEPIFDHTSVVHVPLQPGECAEVRLAEARGSKQSGLIHQWIAEKVHAGVPDGSSEVA